MTESSDEQLAELCEQVWVQVRGLDTPEILAVLLAVTAQVIVANDKPELCLAHACEMLTGLVRHVPKEGA